MSAEPQLWWSERSAPGPGAIRVFALGGPGLAGFFERLASAAPPAAGQIRLARLQGARGFLDEALAVGLGPAGAELCLHGGPALAQELRRELRSLGAVERPSPSPLFPRPVGALGGLAEAGQAGLPGALGPWAARLLLEAAEGRLASRLERWLFFDPPRFQSAWSGLLARSRSAWPLWRPPRILLLGPTNAGKSTLFNLLLGRSAALVSPLPGTTRDVLIERCALQGLQVELIDGAGQRQLPQPQAGPPGLHRALEAEGQRRVLALAASADLVLWLCPAHLPLELPEGLDAVPVQTFAPAGAPAPRGGLAIDAVERSAAALDSLRALLAERLGLDQAPRWLAGPTLIPGFDLSALEAIGSAAAGSDRWLGMRAHLGPGRRNPDGSRRPDFVGPDWACGAGAP